MSNNPHREDSKKPVYTDEAYGKHVSHKILSSKQNTVSYPPSLHLEMAPASDCAMVGVCLFLCKLPQQWGREAGKKTLPKNPDLETHKGWCCAVERSFSCSGLHGCPPWQPPSHNLSQHPWEFNRDMDIPATSPTYVQGNGQAESENTPAGPTH